VTGMEGWPQAIAGFCFPGESAVEPIVMVACSHRQVRQSHMMPCKISHPFQSNLLYFLVVTCKLLLSASGLVALSCKLLIIGLGPLIG